MDMIKLNNPSGSFPTLSQIMTVLDLCHRCVVAVEQQRPCGSLCCSSRNVITTTAVTGLLITYISSPSLFHFIFSYTVGEFERERERGRERDEICLLFFFFLQRFINCLLQGIKKKTKKSSCN